MSDLTSTPHFLRFARSLAFVATALTGCASATGSSDSGSTGDTGSSDVALVDATGADVDPCSTCVCAGERPPLPDGAIPPPPANACTGALTVCCAAVGPLPPPELPAWVA